MRAEHQRAGRRRRGAGMKTTVNFSEFCDAFSRMGREKQFSYNGKKALFEYLEEIEESTGEEIELDVIALCCEYTEYESLADFQKEYDGYDSIEEIENATQVIKMDGDGFIIQAF